MSVGLIAVTILVLMNIGWERLVGTVESHYGPGGFNPFVNPSMGVPYVLLWNRGAQLLEPVQHRDDVRAR